MVDKTKATQDNKDEIYAPKAEVPAELVGASGDTPPQVTDEVDNKNNSAVPIVEPIFGHAQTGKKRKFIFIGVAVLAVAGGMIAWSQFGSQDVKQTTPTNTSQQPQSTPTEGATISIAAGAVNPGTVKIKQGQAIVWKNDDIKEHQIAADPYPTNTSLPELGKGEVLKPGDSVSFVFEKPGTFSYHDNLDPLKLRGTIIVE